MALPVVLGVDPGLNETGLALRQGDAVLRACVVQRAEGQEDGAYVTEVAEALAEYAGEHPGLLVCVEGVEEPKWFIQGKARPVNTRGIIGTATVLGAVLGAFPNAVIVPPGGNGSAPLSTYPAALVGPRETTGTSGLLRHARSAYDVAGAALSPVLVAS